MDHLFSKRRCHIQLIVERDVVSFDLLFSIPSPQVFLNRGQETIGAGLDLAMSPVSGSR